MTDTAAKIRSIFYSSAILGFGVYGMSPGVHNCTNYSLNALLMFLAGGIVFLVMAEAAAAHQDRSNDLLAAFESRSEIYETEADDNIRRPLSNLFDLDDEPDNLLINDNISARLNGKTYSVSDVNAYFKNGGTFSGLVITAPVVFSSNHLIISGKQNAAFGVNISKYTYSQTKNNLAVFDVKGAPQEAVPDEILKIITDLQKELEPEAIYCLIQDDIMQIAIKTNKSYKTSADAIYPALCNLSLRNIDKGAVHERVKTNQQVHQIKKLR